jgi:crotonobetainyl-CoA:carnitine CoA-transferase CaiB-like acyl-CoA transferase
MLPSLARRRPAPENHTMLKEEFYAEARAGTHGPLTGIRVLEATNYASGPVCGMILSDLGAQSIKCELPGTGDPNRQVGPFIKNLRDGGSSVIYNSMNRGKRCVTLDFRKPEGQDLFRRLAARADIVIENFSPGTMDAWELGYRHIRAVKPDIVYVSISGFGQFGPLHHKKGFDPVGQAMGGLMSVTGEPDGRPLRAGFVIADDMAGWQAAIGALAALHHRTTTGEGQQVDACLTDSQLYASSYGIMAAAEAGHVWQRSGNSLGSGAPMNTYQCKDGHWLSVFAPFQKHFEALCRLMGRDELIGDPRSATWDARGEHAVWLDEIVGTWTATLTAEEAETALAAADIVAARVLDFGEIVRFPHYHARDMIVKAEHPTHGPLTHYGVGTKYSRTPGGVRRAAPLLGEHNAEVYCDELGLSADELAALRDKGIV